MKRTHTIVAGLAGGLSLLVSAAFAAGPGAGMGMHHAMQPGMGGMGTMHGAGPGMMRGAEPGTMAAQSLEETKARLAITPDQEAAWQTYAARVGEQAAQRQAMHAQRHQPTEPATAAPDRMARHLTLMSQHLAGMQGVSTALQELYAVLTPEQRVLIDQPSGHRGSMGPMGRMGRMGHTGHMGHMGPMGSPGSAGCSTGG